MLCYSTGNNFGNIWSKQNELLERIIGNFKSIMYLRKPKNSPIMCKHNHGPYSSLNIILFVGIPGVNP